jgi:mono/diheme cytochrome c family protein
MTRKIRLTTTIAAAAALLAAGAVRAAPAAPASAPKKTAELVAKGKSSYEMNCAACHGDKGLGDGVAAAALQPKPRNLVTEKYRNGAAPNQVFATLEKGIDGTSMTPFAHLPADERWALTYYVLELRGAKSAKK